MGGIEAAVGARLRALRLAHGVSLSELARRTGVGKGTLSELESGLRNPTLSTLFRLTTALELPLSAALDDVEAPVSASGSAVDAWLVERLPESRTEVYRLRVRADERQVSEPHAAGVTEQVLVVSGRLLVGPKAVSRSAGHSISYAGDRAHVWQAADKQDVSALLVMRYPTRL